LTGRALAITALLLAACNGEPAGSGAPPDPRDTARALLALHELDGVQPAQRSDEAKGTDVHRDALAELIADLESTDRFTADLYVGFVVGALARHQTRLFVAREGSRATVSAGKARIAMRLEQGRWRILLAESVPDEIKRRASQAKQEYEAARARGQGAGG
jgi:hypothetical protein